MCLWQFRPKLWSTFALQEKDCIPDLIQLNTLSPYLFICKLHKWTFICWFCPLDWKISKKSIHLLVYSPSPQRNQDSSGWKWTKETDKLECVSLVCLWSDQPKLILKQDQEFTLYLDTTFECSLCNYCTESLENMA